MLLKELPSKSLGPLVHALHSRGVADMAAHFNLRQYNLEQVLKAAAGDVPGRARIAAAVAAAVAEVEVAPEAVQRATEGDGGGAGGDGARKRHRGPGGGPGGPLEGVDDGVAAPVSHSPSPPPPLPPEPQPTSSDDEEADSKAAPPCQWTVSAVYKTDGVRLLAIVQRPAGPGRKKGPSEPGGGWDPGRRLDRRQRVHVEGADCDERGSAAFVAEVPGMYHAHAFPRGPVHGQGDLPPMVSGGCAQGALEFAVSWARVCWCWAPAHWRGL
jgi:hypothetical protein